MTEKYFKITGTFEVIYKDIDEENAIMQTMDSYLASLSDECDDNFKSVDFEFYDSEELEE